MTKFAFATGRVISSLGKGVATALAGVSAIGFALWIIAGFISLKILAHSAPLTAADIQASSWLSSPTTALHFTTGTMAAAFIAFLLLGGMTMLVLARSPMPLIAAAILSLAINQLDQEAATRVGMLDGVIRIGCYVPNSAECRDQMGLPRNDAPSIYATPGGKYADWYQVERQKVVSGEQVRMAGFHSIPFTFLLRAPLYIGAGDQLKTLLEAQRNELSKLKAEAVSSQS